MPVRRYLAAATLPLLVTAVTALPASATGLDSATSQRATAGPHLLNRAAGFCLDASVSQGVTLKPCNRNSPYQKWSYPSNGFIFHLQSDRCLDASVSQGVRLMPCNFETDTPSPFQVFARTGKGQLRPNAAENCVDGSLSHGVRLVRCNTSDYQWWIEITPDMP